MKRYIVLYLAVVVFFVALQPAVAQKQDPRYIDSMLRALQHVKDDTDKANILYNLSTEYFNSNTDKGINYGEQGVDLARRLGWKQGMVKLYNTLGNCCSFRKNYEKALDYYQKGLKSAEELNDKHGQAIVLRNIGNVYSYKIRDYQKASDYYARCLRIQAELGNVDETAVVLSEMGSVHYLRKDYAKAIECFQGAIKKGEAMGDKRVVAENLASISDVYNSQGNYPKALEHALLSQKFLEAVKDKRGIAEILCKQGVIYNNQRDYQRALDHFLRSLKMAEEMNRTGLIAQNLQGAGDVYVSLGDHPRAIQYFHRALRIIEAGPDKVATGITLACIGKCYLALAQKKSRVQLPDSIIVITMAEKLQRAHYYLTRAIDVQKETGNFDELQESYERLSEVQGLRGDSAGARESYKQHMAYLEGMYNKDKSEEVARKDMQYVFNKKQETLKQEGEKKEMALQKEMQLNALRYEYEKKQASATSEREREQLKYEEELKQKQITYEFERKQAALEAKTALENANLEKRNEVNAIRLREAKRERRYYIAGMGMLAILLIGIYNRFAVVKKNKNVLEEKNRQIAAEKENADKLRVRAEESEKFKQLFLANMSHEIRTPMNAVSGMTEILLEKGPRNDQVGYLQAISKSSEILLHIINDILDLSKIEAGKMELEAIDLSLADTLKQVADTLSHRAEDKGLQLVTTIREGVTDVVVGDPYRLNQILINLGGNAIKFTERGSVEIEVRQLNSEGNNVTLQFSINDTGIGIPQDKIDTLFSNFAQVNNSDTRKYGGTGLGLSISKQLVELHKGKIFVESVPGSGTTFSFIITYPKGSPEKLEQRASQEKRADGSILNGLHVLIVDDNEYNRIVVSEILQMKADITMDMATNGEEAVEAVKNNRYDVVLMDVQMPVMSGIDATTTIRNTLAAPNKDVPIIALTASTLRSEIDKFMACGMNGYVGKPFKAWLLINTMADVTGRKKPGEPLPLLNGKQPDPKALHHLAGAGTVTNAAYLHEFCEGDEARMNKYIKMYLHAVPAFLEKLKEARDAKNLKEIAMRIHAFKPNWLIMGMKGTGALGGEIERLCEAGNESAVGRVNQLLEQTVQSVRELEEKV